MTAGRLSLIHGNALSLPLAAGSVHLIVSSPPYFALRSYRDGAEHYDGQLGSEATPHHFLAALWAVMDECHRVLRDDGNCWINLGDKHAGSGGANDNSGLTGVKVDAGQAKTVDRYSSPRRYNQDAGGLRPKSRMLLPHRFVLGLIDPEYRQWTEHRAGLTPTADPPQWICRMDVVQSKLNGLPESVTDRVRASHESWFHMVKSERYFAAMDEVREEAAGEILSTGVRNSRYGRPGGQMPGKAAGIRSGKENIADAIDSRAWSRADIPLNPLGKLPGSVWEWANEPLILPPDFPQHFAAFASWPIRRIVSAWSPSGVCVACGFLLGSSYDKGLLGVRRSDHLRAHLGPRGTPLGTEAQSVLLESMLESTHGTESYEHEVPASDDPRLRRGMEARSSDGAEERLHDGAPVCDGRAPWADAGQVRGGASPQRGQDGQPDRESGIAQRGGSQSPTEARSSALPVPTLRRSRPDVRELVACPHCGGRDFARSVIADPFSGTGTAPIVAAALGRHGIGVDLSWDYHITARWRDRDGGLRAKALGVDRPERQIAGQASLFDGLGQ